MNMSQKKSTSSNFKKCLVPHMYSIPLNLINRGELLLPYKSYVKKQSKERSLKQLNVKIEERYKTRNKALATELMKLDDELDHLYTVTEYGKEFFEIVNGRPLHHCIPLYKSLNGVLNKRFRTVQEISFKKDSALNIDINFRMEQNIYYLTLQKFSEEAKAFDKFIMEDYKKSMKILDEEDKLTTKLDTKIVELQNFADESFSITSRLLGLNYKYGLQQNYGRFLYYLSPPMWRSNNRQFARSVEIEAKGFDFGSSYDEDTFPSMFENMRRECCTSPIKPVLYFTHPQDLLEVFNGIEEQLLYHLCRQTQLIPHIKSAKKSIRMFKEKMDQDSAAVMTSIKKFQNLLSLCEERHVYLKNQFFKILHGFFYEATGALDVLKFIFHLEFCYSKIFHNKPINLDMVTIAKAIEKMYMDYSKRLDAIQSVSVRAAMTRCMESNNQKMHKAKAAARELRLFLRLERELLIAHNLLSPEGEEINVPFKYLPKNKRKCAVTKTHKHKISYHNLTDAETDYLTLFTDWTKNDDPALYLQSLNFDKDRNIEDD